jgi:hypothetical protein
MTEPLSQAEKDRDGHDGYLVALKAIRIRKIRAGELEPMSEEERREAHAENQ